MSNATAKQSGSRRVVVRVLVYVAAAVATVVVITQASDTLEPTISAVVQAIATIALAAVGAEALLYNRALVDAARTEAAATLDEARATLEAVQATRASTIEVRRLALLASVPFLRLHRPNRVVCSDDRLGPS